MHNVYSVHIHTVHNVEFTRLCAHTQPEPCMDVEWVLDQHEETVYGIPKQTKLDDTKLNCQTDMYKIHCQTCLKQLSNWSTLTV